MTITRTHKAYMRGGIWMLALIGLIMLPGFRTAEVDAQPMAISSQ
jgi:hypothetical protein